MIDNNEILEGNKLIAEFMDGFIREGYNHPYQYVDFKDKNGIINETVRTGNLKYHSSWDWLMPVVEKISGMGYNVEQVVSPKHKVCRIYKSDSDVPSCGAIVNPETWNAVVQFIQWYNQNKK